MRLVQQQQPGVRSQGAGDLHAALLAIGQGLGDFLGAFAHVGGDLDEVTGKRCTFLALPWRWPGGDGCMVRIIAVIDPDQTFRFETAQ